MKVIIYGMSFPRKTALKHLSKNAENIRDHLIKCVVYKDIRPEDLHHWIYDELCLWLTKASEIKSESRLKPKDIRTTVFGEFGDSIGDAKIILEDFKDKYCTGTQPYPDFEITQNLIDTVYLATKKLQDVAIRRLVSDDSYSKDEWYELISPIFM